MLNGGTSNIIAPPTPSTLPSLYNHHHVTSNVAAERCTEMEDESGCVGMEEESLDVTADQAALVNTLSSSVLECTAEQTAAKADRPSLYRTLDVLRVIPAPLKAPTQPLLPLQLPADAPPFPDADGGTVQYRDTRLAPQGRPATVGRGSSPVWLWLCAATSFLCFAALIGAVATVIFKSSDELSRSFHEVERAFKDEGAAVRGAVLVPSTTLEASGRTTPASRHALDASKNPSNRTDFILQAV